MGNLISIPAQHSADPPRDVNSDPKGAMKEYAVFLALWMAAEKVVGWVVQSPSFLPQLSRDERIQFPSEVMSLVHAFGTSVFYLNRFVSHHSCRLLTCCHDSLRKLCSAPRLSEEEDRTHAKMNHSQLLVTLGLIPPHYHPNNNSSTLTFGLTLQRTSQTILYRN